MPNYVILNDDYLSDGYVESSYVGTDSDLYVETGYIQDAIEGTATLSAQASVVADLTEIQSLGTIIASTSASVTASAGVIFATSSATLSSQADTQTSGGAIRPASTNISGAFDATLVANGILRSTHLINSSATISAVGNFNPALGSATLDAGSNDDQTWDGDIEWDYPPGVVWGPALDAKPAKIVGGDLTYSLDTVASMNVDGDRTARADITVSNFASVSVDAVKLVKSSSTFDSTTTQTVDGDVATGVIDQRLDAVTTLTARGIFQVAGTASIDSNATASINAIKTARGITTQNSQATLTGTPKRFRSSSVEQIDSVATQTTDADRIARTGSSMSSVATQDTTPFYLFGPYQLQLDSNFTFFCNGGRLRNGTMTFNALYSTLSALTLYTIDPFRIYTVPTESRNLDIEQESRILAVKSEERVNTIEQETRAYEVKSETRKLEIQHTKLIDVFGPLDRREG